MIGQYHMILGAEMLSMITMVIIYTSGTLHVPSVAKHDSVKGESVWITVILAKKLSRERKSQWEMRLCISTWMLINVRKERAGANITETQRKKPCRKEHHVEGKFEENKIIFKNYRKFEFISEETTEMRTV